MSKLSLIEREKKRYFLRKKYFNKIHNIKFLIKNNNINNDQKNILRFKLQNIPKNALFVRKRNRCFLTGRPRGYFRRFGLSRNVIRYFAFKGYIPGLFKSS